MPFFAAEAQHIEHEHERESNYRLIPNSIESGGLAWKGAPRPAQRELPG
jgi:hypothetical protein